jgi:hypothetical protein
LLHEGPTKESSHPNLYTLPRRERDPMGTIFPSIGIVVWLGAASCWAATQDVARTFGYQPLLGKPLFEHIYSPLSINSLGGEVRPPRAFWACSPSRIPSCV